MQDRRLPRRTTIRISGSRRSRGRGRSPGSRRRTSGRWRRFGTARFRRRSRHARGDSRPARQDSLHRAARRRSSTISGRMRSNPRGLWRRTTLESFRLEQPAWEILLDVDALAAAEGEDWIWSGATTRPGTHDRAILRLSRGGSDAVVLREFDLARKSLRERRLSSCRKPRAAASWLDPDTLLLSSAWGGDVTTSGYARTVRLWRRGHRPGADAGALRGAAREHVGRCRHRSHRGEPRRSGSSNCVGFFDVKVWLADAAGDHRTKLDLPTDVQVRCASRLDDDQAAHGVDGRRQDLPGRHAAGHQARRVPGRRPRLRRAVRARRAALAAGFLLERRTSWCCRSSTICSRCSKS